MSDTGPLEHLAMDAAARQRVRFMRIQKNPGRATVDDVIFLCELVRDQQKQLDYINNELPRVRMYAASRAGSMGK